jgi:hypothetical protein
LRKARGFHSNPYRRKQMDSNSVPQIQIEDSKTISPEQKAAIFSYLEEVIAVQPELGPDELGEHLLDALHTVAAFKGREDELESFKNSLIEELHTAMHAQAKNFAEHTAKALKEELSGEYEEYKKANKMSGTKKVCAVLGTVTVAGVVYYLGRRNGRTIGRLEVG